MEFEDRINAIKFIRPNAHFVLRDEEIEWLDKGQIEPSPDEIKEGLIAFKNYAKQLADEEKAKKDNLTAKLKALGLTIEDLQTLGL